MTFSLYMQGTVSNKTSCRIHLKDPSSELNSLSEELLKGNHQKTHVHFTWDETYKSFDPHRPDLSVPCIVIEWAHDDVMAGYELFGVVEDCMRGLNRNLSLRKFMQKIDGEEALTFVLNKKVSASSPSIFCMNFRR